MSRKAINPNERKIKFTITIDPVLYNKITELYSNKSKFIESLILTELNKNKI